MRATEHNQLPVTGYLDRLSCRPGEAIGAKVSLRDPGPCQATLQRLTCADPNPDGPGVRIHDLSARFATTFQGRNQPIARGSYADIPSGPPCDPAAGRTWTALVHPGRTDTPQAVLTEGATTLGIGPEGAFLRLPDGTTLATGAPLSRRRWYRIHASVDPTSQSIIVAQSPLGRGPSANAQGTWAGAPAPGPVRIAAGFDGLRFTGKIEAPSIHRGFTWDASTTGPTLAAWDFARGIDTLAVIDTGPHGCHGTMVNLPARGMVGAYWTGAEHCWRHAPADYAAVHFHADDLNDCGWETDFTVQVPRDLPSGCYMLHLTCNDGEDWLPFYVLPPKAGPKAPIAFLASTFTYIAYANHARGNTDQAFRDRVAAWGAYPHFPDDYPVYGRSTYNLHADGSGVSLSSRLRPVLTMRPGYLTFNDAKGSGLRHFPADTHLTAWLEDKGFAFDIITDEDLDNEGLSLLAGYRTVLTGSHPEYHTPRMLDALEAYTATGGRLCYLGGNGFYWRIARNPALLPHTIEIRRAEGGIRAWEAQPGEYYNQLDGGMGGMWRRSRRPPQTLAGVGFSGQGFFEGTHYRRLPPSYDPSFAWMFDGIAEDTLGDYGLSGGGAAGFELDRADAALGTPDSAVILARSEDPPDHVVTVPEELLSHVTTTNGEKPDALRRGEIVYFQTPGGGEVFSVGSITFLGSLWRKGWEGPVSRLLENVVRRFAALSLLALALLVQPARAEPLVTEHQLPLAVALEGAQAALNGCLAQNYRVAVTIVDRAGGVRVTLRADGANPHLLEGALRKAHTSAMLRIATSTVAGLIERNPRAADLMSFDRMTSLGGGLPIKAGDEVLGGIGVAGVPVGGAGGLGDQACAQLGLDKIAEKLAAP
jgi:N,N-dimethylformamidase